MYILPICLLGARMSLTEIVDILVIMFVLPEAQSQKWLKKGMNYAILLHMQIPLSLITEQPVG